MRHFGKWGCLLLSAMGLVLAGCGVREARPSEWEMDRADAALQAEPCIGELVDWHRSYYYHAKYFGDEVEKAAKEDRSPRASGHLRHILGFELLHTQSDGEQRISLTSPPRGGAAASDGDRIVRRAAGTFNLRTGDLNMAHCDAEAR
jgi:hypothetical protein